MVYIKITTSYTFRLICSSVKLDVSATNSASCLIPSKKESSCAASDVSRAMSITHSKLFSSCARVAEVGGASRSPSIENLNVFLLGDIHVRTRIEIVAPDTLHTVTQITTDATGYAAFLGDAMLDIIKETVREKTDIVSNSLCRIPVPSSSLRRAENLQN